MLMQLAGCTDRAFNNPYPPEQAGRNILYTSFTERPKHLDPVQSYSEDEYTILGQIYEPPLQYHYLKRPYELIPQTAERVPAPRYFDKSGRELDARADASHIVMSVYEVRIRPGIRYQPHPALAPKNGQGPGGGYAYHALSCADMAKVGSLKDFPLTGTRELTAEDYAYQIKRLAHPQLHSPVFELMAGYVVGLKELADELKKVKLVERSPCDADWLDLRQRTLAGVEVVDRYTYRIKIHGKYPQFIYWLAMPFFAPMPWEADRFYSQPGLARNNINLDWWPIGTGPYMLVENNPSALMALKKNPHYHGDTYPLEGEAGDGKAGLLADAGKPLPFIDEVVFVREKESIPYWNKFLQGYFDAAGIPADSFDQAVQMSAAGDMGLTDEMKRLGIQLSTSIDTSISYFGFNWMDPLLGGGSERARKLRQAISIAIDQEEFIAIFLNGRGVPAMSPIPPGIFGYMEGEKGINPVVYDWAEDKPRRKSSDEARRLLAEAGYPGGRDAKTGEPLVIHLDTTAAGLGDKSRIDWLTKQLARIDVQLVVRSTDYNRFQEKVRKGNVQLFRWGWNADYPDPENMLFLLHGPQGKVKASGENAANYVSAEFDTQFEKMKNMENGPERQEIIDRMVAILRHDAPWIFGFHPMSYTLTHEWMKNRKPNKVAHNTLKYQRIDAELREKRRAEWNRPVLWPVGAGILLIAAFSFMAWRHYQAHERQVAK